jgi:hypothetical protein
MLAVVAFLAGGFSVLVCDWAVHTGNVLPLSAVLAWFQLATGLVLIAAGWLVAWRWCAARLADARSRL